jgi:hypothetical protein
MHQAATEVVTGKVFLRYATAPETAPGDKWFCKNRDGTGVFGSSLRPVQPSLNFLFELRKIPAD